jgi:hypothetical protein
MDMNKKAYGLLCRLKEGAIILVAFLCQTAYLFFSIISCLVLLLIALIAHCVCITVFTGLTPYLLDMF